MACLGVTLTVVLLALSVGGPWVAWKQANLTKQAVLAKEAVADSERFTRQLLYTSDINSGFDALKDENMGRLRGLLRRQYPSRQEEDRRWL